MVERENIFTKRRSIRRFKQEEVSKETIEQIISWARLSPSAKNLQPVRFVVTVDEGKISCALRYMRWAGYISPRRDPSKDTMPRALILVCHSKDIADERYVAYDIGAAVGTILLGLVYVGLGGCWVGAIDRRAISDLFELPKDWVLHCVVAAGFPAEDPAIIDVKDGDIRYFLDEADRLVVPKRALNEVMLWR